MLRIRYRMRHRNMPAAEGWGSGPAGRISKMRKLVTALVRHERIEGKQPWLDESRGYAERLIQEALTHGDQHKPTMEMADYWLLEKDLVPKLFKVLAPRYKNSQTSYTKMWSLPAVLPGTGYKMSVLELRDNPWPPVVPKTRDLSNSLINVLLTEAKKDYRSVKSLSLRKVNSQIDDKQNIDLIEELQDEIEDLDISKDGTDTRTKE